MKRWVRMIIPLSAVCIMAGLASCEGEQGPPGAPGTASCMNCHTDDYSMANYLRPTLAQFEESRHNLSPTYVRRGTDASPVCSRCHTTEGFQVYLATGEEAPLEESSHISCFACHAPHSNENFALRKQGSTEMFVGGPYDKGESNTCVVCHQARPPIPAIESTTLITSTRWGPHYGPQGNLLAGTGFYPLPGSTYDNGGAHNVAIAKGCVSCHMASLPENTLAGGHTFAINYESGDNVLVNSKGCTCHNWNDQTATTMADNYQASFDSSLSELGDLLFARGWLNSAKTQVTINASAPTTPEARGIVFNYLMLMQDKSGGVHNPRFAESVVAAAKVYLQSSGLVNRLQPAHGQTGS